jgi:peptidoglycan/LPS O-acetylase OafA/YrhL
MELSRPILPAAKHIPELDGVRGLACLMVVIGHYVPRPLLPLPIFWGTGVDLFFVLSGFLLGGICLDQLGAGNYFTAFYARRFFRIVPVYFAWLVVWQVVSFAWPVFRLAFDPQFPLWPYAAYVQNFYMAARLNFGPLFLSPTWSLAIEEQFYLLLPGVIWLLGGGRGLVVALALLIASASVSRFLVWYTQPDWLTVNFLLTFSRWDALFLGVLGAWAYRRQPAIWRRNSLWLWAAVCFVGLLASPLTRLRQLGSGCDVVAFIVAVKPSLVSIFYLGIIFLVVSSPLSGRLLSVKPLIWMGSISYGVYLFHQGLLSLAQDILGRPPIGSAHDWFVAGFALACTLFLACASYWLFERPLIRIGRRWNYQHQPDDGMTQPVNLLPSTTATPVAAAAANSLATG